MFSFPKYSACLDNCSSRNCSGTLVEEEEEDDVLLLPEEVDDDAEGFRRRSKSHPTTMAEVTPARKHPAKVEDFEDEGDGMVTCRPRGYSICVIAAVYFE